MRGSRALRLVRRLRFLRWMLTLRLRLRWRGMQLELHGPGDTLLASAPLLEITGTEPGGVLRLEIAEGVTIGAGVELRVHTGLRNVLTLRRGVRVAGGVRFKLRGGTIDVGEQTTVRDYAILKSSGDLRVGSRNTLSYSAVIHCAEAVTLGDGVGLAEHTSVVDSDHRLGGAHHPWDSPISSAPVTLGDLTTILAGAVVLKGTETGAGCVAAAGSILRGEYPPGSLLAGAPATVIRSLEKGRAIGDPADAG